MATCDHSVVEYFPGNDGHHCGYCGSDNTNCSHGMWAHTMTVEDYEQLVYRGWRRSGCYCYKPTLSIACCPMQTIRMDAPNFSISKSQKKVIKMVNRYLIHGIKKGESSSDHEACVRDLHHNETKRSSQVLADLDASSLRLKGSKKQNESGDSISVKHKTESTAKTSLTEDKQSAEVASEHGVATARKGKTYKPGVGLDPNKPKCGKAKLIRLEKKKKKLVVESSVSEDQTDSVSTAEISPSNSKKMLKRENERKSVEEYLAEPEKAESVAHKLEVKLIQSCPITHAFLDSHDEAYKVYLKYQTTIHGDPPSKPTEKQFKSFLVDSPLQHIPGDKKLLTGYGSYHQHYILDGKIIAVGVIDILPHSVSSVYLYYDPDYSFLSLGTYSALREIAFVRELYKSSPDLRYYNMGFYIHSCRKMQYKGQYSPSYIACPEVHTWVPIEKCRPKLDAARYCRLEEDPTIEDEEGKIDLNAVLILQNGTLLNYEKYHMLNPSRKDQSEIEEYAKLVGRTCSQRILLYRR
ncbi:arginyl-tRNA--protein transferase 1-like isoform X2 [Gigantopelta aegis]|uniref:arginyl-tRNA--protein transferase 1-like isoform X2 n=1 Tax=Gigantopelta aegis TaxID=1735272 RepID=UPI001B88CCC8|nr:arginyl-tRNA--protein transferase 1-like isoform X2 [Gigantopelta aegis]